MIRTSLKESFPVFNLVSIIFLILIILRFAFVEIPMINALLLTIIPILLFFILSSLLTNNKILNIFKFIVIIALGISLRYVSMISPTGNDVFWVSQGAVEQFLLGNNPYEATFYVPNNPAWEGIPLVLMTYFPGTIYFETPFYLIFGDVRTAVLFADVGISLLLYFIIRKTKEDYGRAATSFYFLVTSLTFVIHNSIFDYRVTDGLTDPIMTFLLLLSIFLVINKKMFMAAAIIGFAIATRQFAILFFIPILIMWFRTGISNNYKSIVVSIIVFTIVVIPFYLWSPQDFIKDTINGVGNQQVGPSLGRPQWNMSIPAQLSAFDIILDNTSIRIIQIGAIFGLILFMWKKLGNIQNVLIVFTGVYAIFLSFNNFTQYFYWFNIVPFLILSFIFRHIDQNKLESNE